MSQALKCFCENRAAASRGLGLLVAGLLLLPLWPDVARSEVRLVFTGDILLSRQVRAEMEHNRHSPWVDWPPLLRNADWVVGNLEGAVGDPASCVSSSERSPCFAIPEAALRFLSEAGFRTLGTANNHGGDLGETGRRATRQALARNGLDALSFQNSPTFWRLGEVTMGVVAFSMVAGPDGQKVEVPSPILRQKLRLARRLANVVVVYVHWGSELLDWPTLEQRRAAKWLVAQGADLIVGHHPHVIQPFECLEGKPVFYSLGNHLFDQKYPATKEGLLVECRISAGSLSCTAIPTHTPPGSAFPQLGGADRLWEYEGSVQSLPYSRQGHTPSDFAHSLPRGLDQVALNACTQQIGEDFRVAGFTMRPSPVVSPSDGEENRVTLEAVKDGKVQWTTQPVRLLAIDAGRLAGPDGPEMLVTLERHASPLDHEDSPRPYVYEVTPHGPVARWRGTALAWPLLDTALLPGEDGILCALHRGDSYLIPDSLTHRTRIAAYRWNSFGFSGVNTASLQSRCTALFGLSTTPVTTP